MSAEFSEIYGHLLMGLLDSDHQETNERTGTRVKIIPGGCSFTLDLYDGILPTAGLRRVWPHIAAAELAWFLSGEQSTQWLDLYAPRIWSKFINPETDVVDNAYGYRWRKHFGRDQISDAVDALRKNPTDRRVYVGAWDPSQDGLGREAQNVPCPVGFSIYIVSDRLHLAVTLRSLDVFVGLPYDVMDFALLLDGFAAELGIERGTLRLTSHHTHLYEDHWEMAETCIGRAPVAPNFPMPRIPVLAIPINRDSFVLSMKQLYNLHEWPSYSPIPEVIV